MARDSRNRDEKIVMANEHLFYEIQMFQETSNMISNEIVQRNDALRNSVIESFTIHARNLLKFFFDDKPRKDDLVANDYYANPKDWNKIKQPFLKGSTLGEVYERVNKEVVHLSYKRATIPVQQKNWLEQRSSVVKILSRTLQAFLLTASEELIGEKLLIQKENLQKTNHQQENLNFGKSIFPILSCEFDDEGNPQNPKFLGTGFFTVVEGLPLIVSAKHVLSGFRESGPELCLATRYGADQALRLRGAMVSHSKVDLAFMILDPKFFEQNRHEFVPIPIEFADLPIGRDVFTMGYPHSQVIIDEFSNNPIVEIDQFFFKGYVTNILDTKQQQGTSRSYLVNFPSMEGASGSPLLATMGNKTVCVGFMFMEKTMSQKVDQKSIRIMGEEVTLPIYQSYCFGVACDASPLLDAKNLLNDAQARAGRARKENVVKKAKKVRNRKKTK